MGKNGPAPSEAALLNISGLYRLCLPTDPVSEEITELRAREGYGSGGFVVSQQTEGNPG
jgi:hypothetical protein